jgi:hypothetical protein
LLAVIRQGAEVDVLRLLHAARQRRVARTEKKRERGIGNKKMKLAEV